MYLTLHRLTIRQRLFRLRLDVCQLGDERKGSSPCVCIVREWKRIKGKAPWEFCG